MPRKLVLVVEGSERDCRTTEALLEELGYDVVALADVEAAAAVFPYTKADLVLAAFPLPLPAGFANFAVPESPGREFASFVKRTSPQTLVLGIVGAVADARRALISGCDGFLARPLDAQILSLELRQMIGPPRDWPTVEP